jgi:anti-sigma B factor antagonist
MKSQNPVGTPDPASPPAQSTTGRENDKANNKKLKLTLEAEHPGSAIVLHCQGRIIFRDEACALSNIVTEVLPSARRMVVDLAGVDSVDSGGLGELVLTHMWAESAGYMLKFACPKKSVRHLFEITNLVSVFDVYASVPEAMAAMYPEETPSA